MRPPKRIGGFFEMAQPADTVHLSVLEMWGAKQQPAFSNARSALSVLLKTRQPGTVWLPAFICDSVMTACQAAAVQVKFYSVSETLQPDITLLDSAKAGDAVLAVNYFGKAPGVQFLEYVKSNPQLVWIEDCAHALDTGQEAWGDWRLFSPRKLMGVADGGFAVARDGEAMLPAPQSANAEDIAQRWKAAKLRSEDTEIQFNEAWYSANKLRESSMRVDQTAISDQSHTLLSQLDGPAMVKQRQINYHVLYNALGHLSFLKDASPDYAPLGLVIRVPQVMRDRISAGLIVEGIFPAIHWPDLPSPAEQFPNEHQLARELLTLPCDQRYDAQDMEVIRQLVTEIVRSA